MTEAEAKIIQRESGFRPTAQNPTSSAFGLAQMIVSQRQKYGQRLGLNPATTNPYEQIEMFRAYVADRYTTDHNALAFHLNQGWY